MKDLWSRVEVAGLKQVEKVDRQVYKRLWEAVAARKRQVVVKTIQAGMQGWWDRYVWKEFEKTQQGMMIIPEGWSLDRLGRLRFRGSRTVKTVFKGD